MRLFAPHHRTKAFRTDGGQFGPEIHGRRPKHPERGVLFDFCHVLVTRGVTSRVRFIAKISCFAVIVTRTACVNLEATEALTFVLF